MDESEIHDLIRKVVEKNIERENQKNEGILVLTHKGAQEYLDWLDLNSKNAHKMSVKEIVQSRDDLDTIIGRLNIYYQVQCRQEKENAGIPYDPKYTFSWNMKNKDAFYIEINWLRKIKELHEKKEALITIFEKNFPFAVARENELAKPEERQEAIFRPLGQPNHSSDR